MCCLLVCLPGSLSTCTRYRNWADHCDCAGSGCANVSTNTEILLQTKPNVAILLHFSKNVHKLKKKKKKKLLQQHLKGKNIFFFKFFFICVLQGEITVLTQRRSDDNTAGVIQCSGAVTCWRKHCAFFCFYIDFFLWNGAKCLLLL